MDNDSGHKGSVICSYEQAVSRNFRYQSLIRELWGNSQASRTSISMSRRNLRALHALLILRKGENCIVKLDTRYNGWRAFTVGLEVGTCLECSSSVENAQPGFPLPSIANLKDCARITQSTTPKSRKNFRNDVSCACSGVLAASLSLTNDSPRLGRRDILNKKRGRRRIQILTHASAR